MDAAVVTGVRWSPCPPPLTGRLVVLAPHPDDEILGAAAIMRWANSGGHRVLVIGVTDGEASHPHSRHVTTDGLRARRSAERSCALDVLGVTEVEVDRLGLPDHAVASSVEILCDLVGTRLRAEPSTILVPSPLDGHPDHRACHDAGVAAAAASGTRCYTIPIWARVDRMAEPPRDAWTLWLDPSEQRRKQAAVAAHRSQVEPLAPDGGPEEGPVLDADAVAAMTSDWECVCP